MLVVGDRVIFGVIRASNLYDIRLRLVSVDGYNVSKTPIKCKKKDLIDIYGRNI